MSDETRGIYKKYVVERVSDPDGKHFHCDYFVLDWTHDEFAIPAARAYAAACEAKFPGLARDLRDRIAQEVARQTIGKDRP